MIDLRLRTKIAPEELDSKKGKIVTDDDYNVLVTRDCLVRKPDGSPLAIYQRGLVPSDVQVRAYEILHELRDVPTWNRGMASGTKRPKLTEGRRNETARINSALLGAFERTGNQPICRLTAWTGEEVEKFGNLLPFLRFINEQFADRVPDRYRVQAGRAMATDPAWVIEGTAFTTVTVNNTYSTGVHTDKGDLDEGFSNLTVFRRGPIRGGVLVFPEYRVGVDMKDGDLLLMDAHEWHGNTALYCACGPEALRRHCRECGAERISVVCYYRTKMVGCGTPETEAEKRRVYEEQRVEALVGE